MSDQKKKEFSHEIEDQMVALINQQEPEQDRLEYLFRLIQMFDQYDRMTMIVLMDMCNVIINSEELTKQITGLEPDCEEIYNCTVATVIHHIAYAISNALMWS